MCGRYGRTTSATTFAKILDAEVSDKLDDTPHFNRPPGTFQACALRHPKTGQITMGPAWWGFTPSWATDRTLAQINARSETAAEKRLFAKAFAERPCVLPLDWWFEWARAGDRKQPFAIRPADEAPFFLAGIWSKAKRLPDNDPAAGQVTFAILTGAPADEISPIHSRQPQALTHEGARIWLDDSLTVDARREILTAYRQPKYTCWPVSKRVGNPSNDDADIMNGPDRH